MNFGTVGSAMNTYNMATLWNSMSSSNSSSTVPLIGSVDLYVQDSYKDMSFNGQTQNEELQSIFNTVQPAITTSSSVNPKDPNGLLNLQNNIDENLVSQLDASSTSTGIDSILSQYNSIEGGTYKLSSTSIMNSNQYNLYNTVNAVTSQIQPTGNILNAAV